MSPEDSKPLSLEASAPERDSQPEAGINAALGTAFTHQGAAVDDLESTPPPSSDGITEFQRDQSTLDKEKSQYGVNVIRIKKPPAEVYHTAEKKKAGTMLIDTGCARTVAGAKEHRRLKEFLRQLGLRPIYKRKSEKSP